MKSLRHSWVASIVTLLVVAIATSAIAAVVICSRYVVDPEQKAHASPAIPPAPDKGLASSDG